jgi:HSP20 family molecular chaperone IbpA
LFAREKTLANVVEREGIMPGNYRYEEERNRGQARGTSRRGFGERGRDDDMEMEERERYGPAYGREQGVGRFQGDEGSWRRQPGEGRDYGRSLGGRGNYEGYEDEEDSFGSQNAGARETNRYAGGAQGGFNQGGYNQGRFNQGGINQGGYGEGYGLSRYGQSGYEQGPGSSGSIRSQRGHRGGSQADGWTGEPQEMQWGRQQGLYGSSEYGGYISSQRSQKDFQSHVGKGPKGWQRSDERIREEVSEVLARHPEVDASDVEVKVQNCEVTLTGTVTDREAKRIAEDVVERVFGVKDVQNQIKVKPDNAGDREVTRGTDRESRIGTEGQETSSRRATTTSSGTTTR